MITSASPTFFQFQTGGFLLDIAESRGACRIAAGIMTFLGRNKKIQLRWAVNEWPVGAIGHLLYIGDEILPSYIGIIISHYKDPYESIRISWFMSANGFVSRCSGEWTDNKKQSRWVPLDGQDDEYIQLQDAGL